MIVRHPGGGPGQRPGLLEALRQEAGRGYPHGRPVAEAVVGTRGPGREPQLENVRRTPGPDSAGQKTTFSMVKIKLML